MPSTAALSIGFVMTSFAPGGTEQQMIELLRRLDSHRWSVHVACFRPGGEWVGRVAEAAQSVTHFQVESFKSPRLLGEVVKFVRWCHAHQLAVVHTTDMPSNMFGLPSAAIARVPVRIANRREINAGKSLAGIATQRAAYASAHRIVANSRAAADRLLLERIPTHKIRIVANGLDWSRFGAPTARPYRRAVVIVANLRREKGHDVLIDAAPEILRRHPDASFEFVGDGPERSALVARARSQGVLERITFAGHCDDVLARLSNADVFVLPSRSEAFPNAVLEAMAAALPVVASAVGGICELIAHEQTGLLVAPNDPHSLADQICRLMEDDALASRLSESGRARVRARYSFERMVGQFEEIYLTELARRLQPYGRGRRLEPTEGTQQLQPSGKGVS